MKTLGFCLCLTLALVAAANLNTQGQTAPPKASQAKTSGLALPSFSVFGLPPEEKIEILDRPFSSAELEELLVAIEPARKLPASTRKRAGYFYIPMVFYRSRHLFVPQQWTKADIEEGRTISRFFARLARQPDLEIKANDPRGFEQGLRRLSQWFGGLCQNNEDLAAMMFTLDDGPYRGQKVDEKKFMEWKRVGSAILPGSKARFVLMTDNRAPEPMIIGVLNADNSLLWARRLSSKSVGDGHLASAQLTSRAATQLEGYGYKLTMRMGESSVVYLDKDFQLRFYFVSW